MNKRDEYGSQWLSNFFLIMGVSLLMSTGMLTTPLFHTQSTSAWRQLKTQVEQYASGLGYTALNMSDAEWQQLAFIPDEVVTPEVDRMDPPPKLHGEVERAVTRWYMFDLLLEQDEEKKEQAHKIFSQKSLLPKKAFFELSDDAQLLPPDMQTVVRATTLMVLSTKLLEKLKSVEKTQEEEKQVDGWSMDTDTELFLSEMAIFLKAHPDALPITSGWSDKQLDALTKAFWLEMHFRHMLFVEGGQRMTRSFAEGIKNGHFNKEDFLIWKWRWLTNLFGFHAGPGAKFFDEKHFTLSKNLFEKLNKMFDNSDLVFWEDDLLEWAKKTQIDPGDLYDADQKKWLGHVLASFHERNEEPSWVSESILEGYKAYELQSGEPGVLAQKYLERGRDPNSPTPTYLPAVLNAAYRIFVQEKMEKTEALKMATQFFCQFSRQIYAYSADQLIRCRPLSYTEPLTEILGRWRLDPDSVHFSIDLKTGDVREDKDQMQPKSDVAAEQKKNSPKKP